MVKLFVNGAWRAVKIDDYLPINKSGNWLCAYSDKGKLWVSLLEKAYLKVCGGYEAGGSNSSKDLYVFTGWLPEQYDMAKEGFDPEALWKRINRGYATNDALITIGTGMLKEGHTENGLVPLHSYGVLEIVEIEDNRLLLLKNPWGHYCWRGKFSFDDEISWTPSLKKALGYDNFSKDKGVFWIDWDSIVRWFDHLDINWNPDALQYQKSFFDIWKADTMLTGDTFSIKDNPQFCIDF